jgi:hypothetical protein
VFDFWTRFSISCHTASYRTGTGGKPDDGPLGPKHAAHLKIKYYTTIICSCVLTPGSWVPLQKLMVHQPVKKFPAFYRTRKFITPITTARHLSLSWAATTPVHVSPSHFLNIQFNITLPSTPCRYLQQNPLCNCVSRTCHMPCPSHSSWFDHLKNIWWAVQIIKLLVM